MSEQKRFVLRLEADIHRQVSELAANERRSLNNQIATILASYFDPQALRVRLAELERH